MKGILDIIIGVIVIDFIFGFLVDIVSAFIECVIGIFDN